MTDKHYYWGDLNSSAQTLQAKSFATWVHEGQTRKYNQLPYITHPLRCGKMALTLLSSFDAAIAMYLHDGPEDQIERCPPSLIKALYGDRVCDLVQSLTNPSKQYPHLARSARKELDRKHYATAPLIVKVLKAIDRADNLGEMDVTQDPGFALLYASESQLLLDALTIPGTTEDLPDLESAAATAFASLRKAIVMLKGKLNVE